MSAAHSTYPPEGVDTKSPNIARVYDAFLGGKDNFAADRQVVEAALRVTPDAAAGDQANRAFLRRVVRYLVRDAGITQILDIGSGLPTQGNVDEVAREINPSVRTIYVNNDPVVCIHGQALLADARTTEVVTADVRLPSEILGDPVVRQFIDESSQPVGLLMLAILHDITDGEDPAASWPSCATRCRRAAIWPFRASGCPDRNWLNHGPGPSRWSSCSTSSSAPAAREASAGYPRLVR